MTVDEDAKLFRETTEPGIYTIHSGEATSMVAVNVHPRETMTESLDEEVVMNLFTKNEEVASSFNEDLDGEKAEKDRDPSRVAQIELEKKQRLWRYIAYIVLGFVLLEIWYSSHCRRKELNALRTGA